MEGRVCPICSNVLIHLIQPHQKLPDTFVYDCPQCGTFSLSRQTQNVDGFKDSRPLISAWIRRQHKSGNDHPIVAEGDTTGKWFQSLQYMKFPKTITEKMDELLKSYADIAKDSFEIPINYKKNLSLISDVAAKNEDQLISLHSLLKEMGYIKITGNFSEQIQITGDGWKHIEELSKGLDSKDSAFIAMWYDASLDTYADCVKKAVIEAGYEPIIIGEVDFNNFIMDEVIQYIRQSKFLIVDLTCSEESYDNEKNRVYGGTRGGVYWEAGMAYGLGKPVIQTCRDEDTSRSRVHFDLEQYQTILWENEELTLDIRKDAVHINDPSFTERLYRRILSTVGKGSFQQPSET